MVASDTLVGLVGAGILLVALAGVFVFESRQTSADRDLEPISSNVEATEGTLTYTAGTGVTNPVTGQCTVPNTCTPQKVRIVLKLTGAPSLPGSTLRYAVFLTGGAQAQLLGTMNEEGTDYRLTTQDADSVPGNDRLVVSLEKTATPATPSPLIAYAKDFTPPGQTAAGTPDVKGTHTLDWVTGTGSATLAETDAGLQVDFTLSGAKNHSSEGYVYRAWLHNSEDQTVGYTFLGNFTDSGNESTLSVGISGGSIDSYDHIFVTLEPRESTPPRSASEAGGPNMYVARVSAEPAPTLAR